MPHVGFVSALYDCIGTAEGRCLRCGAYFTVTMPNNKSAAEALSTLFDKHLAEKHAEKEESNVSRTFAIAD